MKIIKYILPLALISCARTSKSNLMEIKDFSPIEKFDSRAPVFTGNVEVQMLFNEHGKDSALTGGKVTFSKRARSAWHSHPKGQLLVVTHGNGIVQQWGSKAIRMKAGQVVWTTPSVKHWHGATPDSKVTHFALQEKKGSTNVNWLEKVSDDQYESAVKSLR